MAKKKKVSKKKVNKLIKILPLPILIIVVGIVVVIYLFQSGIISFQKKEINNNPNTTTTVPATTDLPITTGIIPTTTNTVPTTTTSHEEGKIYEDIFYNQFEIHFLELGNDATGDSVFIKAGDNDILIDAGSRANTLINYINKYCKDGKLEYVIATHAHQDHISGFAGEAKSMKNYKGQTVNRNGVLYYFDVDKFIDFSFEGEVSEKDIQNGVMANDNKTAVSSNYNTSTSVYGKYLLSREYAINNGATYYTAKELWDNNNISFNLANDISFDILYNYYYFNPSSDENNYSVCTMFNYKDYHFIFTGDLEKKGEEKLSSYYDGSTEEKTLPHCVLYKGGHHGSYTASNEVLLSKITPEICCVCCCAGSTEYSANVDNQFPSQAFIDRIAKYTSRVYVTTMYDEVNKKNISMNGNIIISSNGIDIGIKGSKNITKLKDTTWFNENVFVNSNGNNVSGAKKTDFFTAETEGATVRKRRTWPDYGKE